MKKMKKLLIVLSVLFLSLLIGCEKESKNLNVEGTSWLTSYEEVISSEGKAKVEMTLNFNHSGKGVSLTEAKTLPEGKLLFSETDLFEFYVVENVIHLIFKDFEHYHYTATISGNELILKGEDGTAVFTKK